MAFAKFPFVLLLGGCIIAWTSNIEAVINTGNGNRIHYNNDVNVLRPNYNFDFSGSSSFTINKVSMTQKGYIQFLKYLVDVPPLADYTFCIWMRSNNLNHSHPILSYSKHEEERLIRVWISPQGTSINLEILKHPVFQIPVQIVENHWYHICQSWTSNQATWELYLNGQLKSRGHVPELRGTVIEEGGDIVVGQEYTDFDKGLDDGIEGDVFGFNLVLSGTGDHYPPSRRHFVLPPTPSVAMTPPPPVGYASFQSRGGKTLGFLGDLAESFAPSPHARFGRPMNMLRLPQSRAGNQFLSRQKKPIGLRLVELSYNCVLGRGSPVKGRQVLINWTSTPVRVFGGAILKTAPPFCTGSV